MNVIVHPDYLLSPERLDLYDEFLRSLAALDDGWHALPREVAAWWKARAQMDVDPEGKTVLGAGEWPASVAWAQADGPLIVYSA